MFQIFLGFSFTPFVANSPRKTTATSEHYILYRWSLGWRSGRPGRWADERWVSFDRLLIRPRRIRCRVEGARCFQGVGLSATTAIKEAGEFRGGRAAKRNSVRNLRVWLWTEMGGGVVCPKCVLPTRHSETTHPPWARNWVGGCPNVVWPDQEVWGHHCCAPRSGWEWQNSLRGGPGK